jgi:hypothetical protein
VASQAGAAAGVRAGVAGAKVLARGGTASSHAASHASASARAFLSHTAHDIARLRLTIRWHARSARPILGAVAGEFIRHLLRSVRQARPRHLIAGIAVAAAVLIAAVYGATGKDRRAPNRPPVPVSTTSASSQPALASLAPAPDADAAALVESLKEKSAALLAPSTTPQGTPAAPKAAVPGADTDQERAASPGESMVGTLLIASAPKGAKVTIDGIPRGVSPLSVSRLRAGNRIVRLELDGYQRWSWAVYVSASRQTRLNVSLVPDSGPSPSSAVTNTAAAAK